MSKVGSNQRALSFNKAESFVFNKVAWAVFASAFALYAALRLWHLTDSCLWFDEIFSVHAARHDWLGMIGFVAADLIHPPLFYLLLKAWIALGGESLLWLRLFPALMAIAAVLPFYLLCRELHLGSAEINLALFLMAVNGHLIKYAQELRMYSLLLFLSLWSFLFFIRFIHTEAPAKKFPVGLCIFNLLLIYTHYYGWMVIGVELVYVSIWMRQRLRLCSAMIVVLIVSFSPWLYAVAHNSESGKGLDQNLFGTPRPNLVGVLRDYVTLSEPLYARHINYEPLYLLWFSPYALLLLLDVPILLFMWHVLRHSRMKDKEQTGQRRIFCWLFSASFLPIVIAFIASQILPQSVWGTRHLIIMVVPHLILAAVSLRRLHQQWLRITLLFLIGFWIVLAAAVSLVGSRTTYSWCAWEPLTREIIRAETSRDEVVNVYAFEDAVAYSIWFSLDSIKDKKFQVSVIKGIEGLTEDAVYFLPRRFDGVAVKNIDALTEEHFWVAFRAASWDTEKPPLKTLTDKGYQLGEHFSVNTPGIETYIVSVTRR